MDIKSVNTGLVNNRLNDTARGQDKAQPGGVAARNTPAADKVTLSASSQVQDLEAKAVASNIDNSAKVESIKAAIKDGSYQVNAENVAKKLMQTETLLAGA